MYLFHDVLAESRVPDAFKDRRFPTSEQIETAVLRGRKMRSEAFWNLLTAAIRPFGRALAALRKYRETQQATAALRQMDAHLLADIGLTPGDIERAALYGRERKPAAQTKATPTVANDAGTRKAA